MKPPPHRLAARHLERLLLGLARSEKVDALGRRHPVVQEAVAVARAVVWGRDRGVFHVLHYLSR